MVAPIQQKTFDLRGVIVRADDLCDGILINPALPEAFDSMENSSRPHEHVIWWGVPFIRTHALRGADEDLRKRFPDGVRYELRCLDGGAWDRSTWWGEFPNLQEAIAFAKSKPTYSIYPVHTLG